MKCIKVFFGMVGIISCLLLSSCHKDLAPGDYDSSEVGKIKKVVPGTVISVRPVRLHSKNEENLTAHVGTLSSETTMNRSHGYEYVIRLNSGGIISVVQAENVKIKRKQHILVIYGKNTRVVPDHGSEEF